jgi:hypothetical protein
LTYEDSITASIPIPVVICWFSGIDIFEIRVQVIEAVLRGSRRAYLSGLSCGTWWLLIVLGAPVEVSYYS